jgi:hypothetical protein
MTNDLVNHISFWCSVEHLSEQKEYLLDSSSIDDAMLESDIILLESILFSQKYYN